MKLFLFDDCPGEDYSILVDADSTNVRFYKIPKSALTNNVLIPKSAVAAYDVDDKYLLEIPYKIFDSYKVKSLYNERILNVSGQTIKIYPSGFWTNIFAKTGMYYYNSKPFGVVVMNDQNDDVYVPQYILDNLNPIPITEDDIKEKPQCKVKLIHCYEGNFEKELQKYLDNGYELHGNLSACYCSPGKGVHVYQLVIKKYY